MMNTQTQNLSMKMELIRDIRERLTEKTANILEREINTILNKKQQVVLGLPGGSSVEEIFKSLKNKKIDWRRVQIFMVDERLVPFNNPTRLIKDSFIGELISKRKLPKENVHSFNHKKQIQVYSEKLKKHSNSFDIILLSSGEDGHIASLFPEHNSIKNDEDMYILVSDSPKPPQDRISASRKLLSNSEVGILLMFGEGKRQAYENFFNKKLDIHQCPAKIIKNLSKAYLVTDLLDKKIF
jgi:6-phosphogluconolactonase